MTHKRIFVVNTGSGFQGNKKKGCCTPQQPSSEQIVINAGVSDLLSEPKTTLKMTLETRKNFLNNTFYNSIIKFKFA